MEIRHFKQEDDLEIETLFRTVFTNSEGDAQGKSVGTLARELIRDTDENDLYGFVVIDENNILGSIFFSRLNFNNVEAFVLAPVAIHTDHHGKGLGQKLINYGLNEFKEIGVKLVITYGDPKFYSKVGFCPLSAEKIQPPFELKYPFGWQGQTLDGSLIEELSGNCSCVKALNKPEYW